MEYLCCSVQRCSSISRMGSIDETMLNIQLYRKTYLFYDGLWVVTCLYVLCVVALLTF